MIDPSELDTAEFPMPQSGERERPPTSSVRLDIAAKSDKGHKRDNNEDHFLVARAGRHLDTLLSNLPEGELPSRFDDTGYIAVVADGMGGAAGGEVASRLAITTLVNIVLHVPDWILRLDEEHAQQLMRRAASYYREVNERLRQVSRKNPALRGMGTTMTGTYSLGDDLFVVHVGDSRAYLYRDGILRRLTRDHTHAQMLADAGIIRPEAVGTHRLRHVLTNALGSEEADGTAEIHRMRLFDRDRILLCSDGLHDMVEDETILEILNSHERANAACDALVQKALDNGGHDNVTAVVARYSIPEVS